MPPLGGFNPLPFRLGGDSTTGWSSAQHARLCADLIAAKRVAPLAIWGFTNSGSVITVRDYWGQNGNGSSFAPVGTRTGIGQISFIWSDPWLDDYDIFEPLAVRSVSGSGNSSSPVIVSGSLIAGGIQVVTETGGAAADVGAGTIVVG
jgi:hypothetical protein